MPILPSESMPDYPSANINVKAIWEYDTRTLTRITGAPRIDLIGVDASFETSTGTRASRIDAPISSRAAPGDSMALTSGAVTSIWTATTRTLTGFTGTPRADLIGVDASFEASTGARVTKIDRLANMDAFDAPIEGSVTFGPTDAAGTVKTVVVSEIGVPHFLEGFIDLSPIASGETMRIIQRLSLVTPVSYKTYASEDYTGAQTLPILYVVTKPARYGIKVDMVNVTTVAATRTFTYQFFRRRVA